MIVFLYILMGLTFGSFLHAWISRNRKGESIVNGRSWCPECKHQLAWYDLIPIFSWLFLKAKCRYCHKKIPWHYPAAELLGALIFVLLYLALGNYFSW